MGESESDHLRALWRFTFRGSPNAAPAMKSALREVHKVLCLLRNLHFELLCLPRNVHFEVHKALRLPQNLHFEVHKVLCLPRINLHFKVHKVLHLPRFLKTCDM